MVRILLMLAVIPGILFMSWIYRKDKIESEPVKLIVRLMIFGALAAFPVALIEGLLEELAGYIADEGTVFYQLLDYFIAVALIEEGGKYFVTRRCTWNNPNFNFKFDGVVYAVAASMGFAILENILYVFDYGIGTALLRAVTSIPGHGIFGVFMGYYYGLAKSYELDGNFARCRRCRKKAVLIPLLIHGFYDFTASSDSLIMLLVFFVFLMILYVIAYRKVKLLSATDEPV